MPEKTDISQAISRHADDILKRWLELQSAPDKMMGAAERQETSRFSSDFLKTFTVACGRGAHDISAPHWAPVREILENLSASRANAGYSPSDTAAFVFSLKKPVFEALLKEHGSTPGSLTDALWEATTVLDSLGLLVTEFHQRTREGVISRQQEELLELSTPVVRLWENVLALPLIGTLDSARTQVVMQNLLDAIVETRSDYAIIDITGVPVVDTLVAQHLLKTVAAARLMGADCLISGVRPQIAQTIIHLGVDLSNVTTKATLADAFSVALRRSGLKVTKTDQRQSAEAR